MQVDMRIDQDDLKAIYVHTRAAYGNITFQDWCQESEKSYMAYFKNKELYSTRQYTYSQFVNAQILAIV